MKNLFIPFGFPICCAAGAQGDKSLPSVWAVINDRSLMRPAAQYGVRISKVWFKKIIVC
jgi:hypothetical protein